MIKREFPEFHNEQGFETGAWLYYPHEYQEQYNQAPF